MSKEIAEKEGFMIVRRVCFSIVAATLCVIMSAVLHLIDFKELAMYCTISGGVFLIIAWFWIMNAMRNINNER